jgi:flavin-binding protein dodecin
MSDRRVDPVVVGRSSESFARAAQNAVDTWEEQRGGEPDEPTTLKVVDMYVVSEGHIGDYIVVLKTGG